MRVKSLVSIMFVSLTIMSCSGIFQNSIILPDGTEITQQEKAVLDSLTPKAHEIFALSLGNSRAMHFINGDDVQASELENAEIISKLKQLLKDEFGENYSKYIIEGEYSNIVEACPVISRGFEVNDGKDPIYLYSMACDVKYCILPWGSWNWASTSHQKRRILPKEGTLAVTDDDVLKIRACVRDEANPNGLSVSKSQTHTVTAVGKPKYGFFPKFSCTTEHEVWDEVIDGGHILRTYNWSMN